jgi:hypothetical protein
MALYWGDNYRSLVIKYIKECGFDISNKWNYQFGIFTGTTFHHIYEEFQNYKLPVEKILAFDSFEGLPEEKAGLPINDCWYKGNFDMHKHFETADDNEIIKRIEAGLPENRTVPIEWHKGFFNTVLTGAFLTANPKPAFWVDLDVDQYQSTIDVLDFMFKNKLIINNTLTSFDDWGGTEEYKGGESLAWKEMCEKYGIKYKEIVHWQSWDKVHCNKAFLIEEING